LPITKVDPKFSNAARATKYSGVVLVNLVLDAAGKPAHVQILRPTGLGLDEQAVAAVAQYAFQPAMENGSPVAVELNVEVNFQTF
jgi:protein TonB